MDPETDELLTPVLEAIELGLCRNYDEFDRLRTAWGREWQLAMVRRAKRRARERAAHKANSAIAHDDDAA